MSKYFNKFPVTQYDGINVRDITRRNSFKERVLSDPFLFLPYTVKEDERPEDVALYYYDSVEFTWLVLMANDMLDPYYDWYLPTEKFHAYLAKKYASQSNGSDPLSWTTDQTSNTNIVCYYNDDGVQITPETFSSLSYSLLDWKPLRVYEYEEQLNEQKREIVLVDKQFKEKVSTEFKSLIRQ